MKTETVMIIEVRRRIARAIALVDKALPTVYDSTARDTLLDIRLELTADRRSE